MWKLTATCAKQRGWNEGESLTGQHNLRTKGWVALTRTGEEKESDSERWALLEKGGFERQRGNCASADTCMGPWRKLWEKWLLVNTPEASVTADIGAGMATLVGAATDTSIS